MPKHEPTDDDADDEPDNGADKDRMHGADKYNIKLILSG